MYSWRHEWAKAHQEAVATARGYISSDIKTKLQTSGTELIYPYRNYKKCGKISNDGKKKHRKSYKTNTDREKIILKNRYKIENMFATTRNSGKHHNRYLKP